MNDDVQIDEDSPLWEMSARKPFTVIFMSNICLNQLSIFHSLKSIIKTTPTEDTIAAVYFIVNDKSMADFSHKEM